MCLGGAEILHPCLEEEEEDTDQAKKGFLDLVAAVVSCRQPHAHYHRDSDAKTCENAAFNVLSL